MGFPNTWAEEYILLGLRLEKHFPGYVDAYYGPAELRSRVNDEPPHPPKELVRDAVELQRSLPQQGYDAQRSTFLHKQLRGIETVARRIAGETLGYTEEVERCFDISPRWIDEEVFRAAHAELEAILPEGGTVRQRLQAYRDRFLIADEQVLPLVQASTEELRRRTQALVSLPPGEDVAVIAVKDQPWAAYNWYLGQYRSKIEINLDLPMRALGLLELFSHETYPGHHVEAALKEQQLYHERGQAEQCIALISTPANVLAEGIANVGIDLLFDRAERIRWKNEVLYPQAGLAPVDLEQALRPEQAVKGLRHVPGNAALLLYEQNHSPEQVVDYLEQFDLSTREEAEHLLRFLQSPPSRSYIFCYGTGQDLIEAAMERVEDRRAFFRRLLSEPWTPSAVAAMAAP